MKKNRENKTSSTKILTIPDHDNQVSKERNETERVAQVNKKQNPVWIHFESLKYQISDFFGKVSSCLLLPTIITAIVVMIWPDLVSTEKENLVRLICISTFCLVLFGPWGYILGKEVVAYEYVAKVFVILLIIALFLWVLYTIMVALITIAVIAVALLLIAASGAGNAKGNASDKGTAASKSKVTVDIESK